MRLSGSGMFAGRGSGVFVSVAEAERPGTAAAKIESARAKKRERSGSHPDAGLARDVWILARIARTITTDPAWIVA